MDRPTKTTTEAAQAFAATAEKGSAQAKEAFEKMSANTAESAELMRTSYSTAIKGAQDYNNKVLEFAQANTKAAMDFVQKLSGVKSIDKVLEVQTEFAKSAYETFVAESQKIAGLYTDLAKQTFKPLESMAAKFTLAAQ